MDDSSKIPAAPSPFSSQITIHPDTNGESANFISGNKGLIIAMAIVLVVAIIGVGALMNMNSSKQYQGMIEKVRHESQQLQNSK